MRDDKPDNVLLLWERLVIRSLVGGIGVGLALLCGIASYYLYQSMPRGWDRKAIRAVQPETVAVDLSAVPAPFAGAANPLSSQKGQSGRRGVVIADLQNTTDRDATLAQSAVVMESDEVSHTLRSSKFRLDRDSFLPGGQTVSVTLIADDPCAPGKAPETCIESYFHGITEIVLFDKADGYEIHVPLKSVRVMRVEGKQAPRVHAKLPSDRGAAVR
jgi:hypothetical protein